MVVNYSQNNDYWSGGGETRIHGILSAGVSPPAGAVRGGIHPPGPAAAGAGRRPRGGAGRRAWGPYHPKKVSVHVGRVPFCVRANPLFGKSCEMEFGIRLRKLGLAQDFLRRVQSILHVGSQ